MDQQELRERIVRIETKLDVVVANAEKMEKIGETATEALRQAEVANQRLDKQEGNQIWLWRAVGAGVILWILEFVKKGGMTP